MELLLVLVGLIWLLGSPALALVALVLAARALLRPRRSGWAWLRGLGLALAGSALLVTHPLLQLFFVPWVAEDLRNEMIASARDAGCVGQPTSWVTRRYGPPRKVWADVSRPGVEHWYYEPGPFFVFHEDAVGFEVEHGVVTQVYLQVN